MSHIMEFSNREEFREWLYDNCLSSADIWLLFGRADGPKTIRAGEALEEALCFGWIDGQMERIDENMIPAEIVAGTKTGAADLLEIMKKRKLMKV